uniref:Ribonuclease H2 subunit C n=1 Tax=Romanomermis culicivorax TaxID=13658 RepID=A0A915KAP0_ROMCU
MNFENELHSVPCKIHYDGPAPVDQFFHSLREKVENVEQETGNSSTKEIGSLRGRPLVGDCLNLPENCAFFKVSIENDALVDDSSSSEQKNNENMSIMQLTLEQKFDRTIFWNYDSEPNRGDSIRKAIDWLNIARSLASNESLDE